ncbi:unnamed protein product [Parascedosporium putredinis]|uniref:U3 small nucleolar ribonucleoprotein protein IMP3 n=2 Tax=Parascedosporium putredinis TaxID=1442378 RepID=A0A9P1H3E3_9PEZI|nr:unnamed protein product [Parascedosporium putredinis]CAI7995720.1 unnamed protein product [Parascedosporium putredinis]
MVRKLKYHEQKLLKSAVRRKHEDLLLDKLYDMGVLSTKSKLSAVENAVTVSAFARRRLPVVMTRLRMAETVQAATKLIEQGHVRVGTDTITDPAYLVTRGMEDFVTWTVGSKIKKTIMKYRDELDDFELLRPAKPSGGNHYKGFVAGVFSGIAKLAVGHPFDTVKGATPPLVGWMFMDSVMLGSLTVYRRLLSDTLFQNYRPLDAGSKSRAGQQSANASVSLPSYGHGLAGIMAGCTVSFIAAPVEHIKARLQVQYAASKSDRLFKGPLDCLSKIYGAHGIRGIYRGLGATLLFRGFFFCWWGSYDIFTRLFQKHTDLSAPAINFWAGGLSAQVFWITSYPSDVVKQRIMTDPLGGALNDGTRQFPRWADAAKAVYRESGAMGYWRGFLPCFLRAFPANAMALVAFEGVMRLLPN